MSKVRSSILFVSQLLNKNGGFLIFTAIVLFGVVSIGFQRDNQKLLLNQSVTIDKQNQTLEAIKALSVDNKLTSKQLGDTIICMLLVPVSQRTPDTQAQCREQATSQPGIENQVKALEIQSNPQTPVNQFADDNNKTEDPIQETQKSTLEQVVDTLSNKLNELVGRGL